MEFLSLLQTAIIFGAMSALPIALWVLFFQKQNHENKKFIFWTFIAGMLAVLPIKAYEQIWNISLWYFDHVNMFQYIADLIYFPSFPRFLSFVIISVIVATVLFFAVALLMFLVEVFASRSNTMRAFRHKCVKISESPGIFLMVGIIFGISAYFLSEVFPSKIWFFVVVGMLEEFVKYLMLRFADEEKIKTVSDAISFAIMIALGFAFIENIIYLARFWDNVEGNFSAFTAFYLLRSTVSVVAHVCFSAILGYFYGLAHFSTEIYREEVLKNQWVILPWIHRLFHVRGAVLFHEAKLLEGMLLAMVVHAIFNSLLELGKIGLVFPFLFLIFALVLNLLHRKSTHIRRGILYRMRQNRTKRLRDLLCPHREKI